jgi:hypothetical protein
MLLLGSQGSERTLSAPEWREDVQARELLGPKAPAALLSAYPPRERLVDGRFVYLYLPPPLGYFLGSHLKVP